MHPLLNNLQNTLLGRIPNWQIYNPRTNETIVPVGKVIREEHLPRIIQESNILSLLTMSEFELSDPVHKGQIVCPNCGNADIGQICHTEVVTKYHDIVAYEFDQNKKEPSVEFIQLDPEGTSDDDGDEDRWQCKKCTETWPCTEEELKKFEWLVLHH